MPPADTCDLQLLNIPSTGSIEIQLLDDVSGVSRKGVYATDQTFGTFDDGEAFRWRPQASDKNFLGDYRDFVIDCTCGTAVLDVASEYCTVTVGGIPSMTVDGTTVPARVDISNSADNRGNAEYRNLENGDTFVLPVDELYTYFVATGNNYVGPYIQFNTIGCADNGNIQTLDVSADFCMVTFDTIPTADGCGGQVDISNYNTHVGLRDVDFPILFPRNDIALEYRVETEDGKNTGPYTAFDTLNCDSGSKTIDITREYCIVSIVGLPENPNCGGKIDIIPGDPDYQNIALNYQEVLLPNDVTGYRWRAELADNDKIVGPDHVFDTIGRNGGRIELDVSEAYCLVSFDNIPGTGSSPTQGQITIIDAGNSDLGYRTIENCESILLPRNTTVRYQAENVLIDGNSAYFDTFNCESGSKTIDVMDQFCLVTVVGAPESSNNGGEIDFRFANNDRPYRDLRTGDTILLPRDVIGIPYRATTDSPSNEFNGPYQFMDTLNCEDGSTVLDVSEGFCEVTICGIPPTNGAQISFKTGSDDNSYREITTDQTNLSTLTRLLFPRNLSGLRYRAETDGSFGTFKGPYIYFDTLSCAGGSMFLDVSSAFCELSVCGGGSDETIDILNGNEANGFKNLETGDTFVMPSDYSTTYRATNNVNNMFDTYGCGSFGSNILATIDLDISSVHSGPACSGSVVQSDSCSSYLTDFIAQQSMNDMYGIFDPMESTSVTELSDITTTCGSFSC